jgi:predicted permease
MAAMIAAAAVIVGVGVGLAALVRTGDLSGEQLVRVAARATSSHGWRRAQRALVATQVAMALALVITAGLLGRSFWNLRNAELGFTPRGLTAFEVALPFGGRYRNFADMVAFHTRVLDALRAQPGVTGAGAVSRVPLSAVGGPALRYKLQAIDLPGAVTVFERASIATSEYFDVMGIPITRGRSFASGDMRGSPGIVLSEALALQLFKSTDVVGRGVQYMNDRGRKLLFQVIGVAGDVPNARIEDGSNPVVYFPQLRDGDGLPPDSLPIPVGAREVQYVVRSAIPPSAETIRRLVHAADASVPAIGIRSVTSLVDAATARVRLTLLLLGMSGAAALLLGIVGVYSVASYAAAQREREFGVRLALGAAPQGVARLVLREGAVIAAFGIAAGLVIAWAGGRLLTALLYRVSPASVAEFTGGVAVIAVVMVLATLVPARRASRTDPAVVLRGE